MCVPVIREGAEGEEGDEAVVSGWIAVHVEAAAARRKAVRRDIGELDRVAEVQENRLQLGGVLKMRCT